MKRSFAIGSMGERRSDHGEVNRLVYELYGPMEEEIKIVKEAAKS